MRNLCSRSAGPVAAMMTTVLLLSPVPSAGQAPAPRAESYTPPRTPDGQPDIQGAWRADPGGTYSVEYMGLQPLGGGIGEGRVAIKGGPSRVVDPPDGRIPYQPWAAAKAKDIFDNHMDPRPAQLDPQARCWLVGAPRGVLRGFQLIQTPGQIVIAIGFAHTYRVIHMDGSPHPPENLKLFMGDSRGRWEGNTLVVDVSNNNNLTWFDVVGSFHSDALHMVERYRIVDANTMNYEVTLEDSKVYTRPWKMAWRLRRNVEPEEMWEEACHEGNHSAETILSRPRGATQ